MFLLHKEGTACQSDLAAVSKGNTEPAHFSFAGQDAYTVPLQIVQAGCSSGLTNATGWMSRYHSGNARSPQMKLDGIYRALS